MRPPDDLRDLLVRELRAAVNARLAGGADPAEVLADLARRLEAQRVIQRAATPEGRAGGASPAA
jgi:hypothetical protein